MLQESIYKTVRELLPRADKNLVESLALEIQRKNVNSNVDHFLEKNVIERIIKLKEFRALGLIKD